MSTPPPPPPAVPPSGGRGEGAEFVDFAARHWSTLAKAAGLVATVVLGWQALTGRVEKVETAQQATVQDVQHLREAMKEDRARDEARFRELDKQREEQARALAVFQTRLDAMDKGISEIKGTLAVILDRLGDPNAASRRSPVATGSTP